MSEAYASHHRHWIDFAVKHGATHPSVFFSYEALVQDTKRLLPELMRRVGFSVDDSRLQCALDVFPGLSRPYPEHGAFYTATQRAVVVSTTRSVSQAAGYVWDSNGALNITVSQPKDTKINLLSL